MATKTSTHARKFDENNERWVRNELHNRFFIDAVQLSMNDLLKSRGHVFLNEVYDSLGMKRSTQGQLAGWLLDGRQKSRGDGFIMLYVSDGREPLIDFNVDRDEIYKKIEEGYSS